MAKYNETTAQILEILLEGPRSTEELAEALECSRSNVTVPLLKLFRAGHVDRERQEQGKVVLKNPGKGEHPIERDNVVWVYGVTEKGEARLATIRGERDWRAARPRPAQEKPLRIAANPKKKKM